MSRKRLKTDDDFLKIEPYKSIINILFLAPSFNLLYRNGVQPKELRTLLVKGYTPYPKKEDGHRRQILSEFRDFLLMTAGDRVHLNQEEIQPGRYKKKKNQLSTTRLENLFNQILQRLERAGWIERRQGYCVLSEKRSQKILQHWHADYFTNVSEPIMAFDRQFVFYVPRNRPGMNGRLLDDAQRTTIADLCTEVSKKFVEIDEVLEEAGKRTAVSLCVSLIEKLNFSHPVHKEFFYICLITDLVLRLNLTRCFTKEPSEEILSYSEPQKTMYDVIIRSGEKYLKKQYGLSAADLKGMVDEYNRRYYIFHYFFGDIIRSMVRSSTAYVVVCERPFLFMGNERPLLSPYDVKRLQSCRSLYEMKALIERIDRKKNSFINLHDLLTEKTKQDTSIDALAISHQQRCFSKETGGREKTSFFTHYPFNREFVDMLGNYGFQPTVIQKELEAWLVLFNTC
jgi:hypothetical protein